ncbi:ISP domain-containing protein [Astrocystis sublimbata]|nr:ISP domain-containing protein [Astrocystis sublimbata]
MAELSIYYSPQVLFWTLSASFLAIALSYLSSINGLGWLSKGLSKSKNAGRRAVRALPGSWYLSEEMYELERRAIFSKKWLLTTHKTRFEKEGDWLRYQVAGYDFVIAKDRTGTINAFHNVCRHRAFPVVTKDEGNNSVLACKYHNWTYALNGNLTKAPSYQNIEGFDKSKNGLFPIHVHIDVNGFIWVNLEAKDKPTIAWNDDYNNIDKQDRFKAYDFDNYKFDHTWQMEGEYNWKLLGDNYNECYHCPTTHPDIPTVADLNAYGVVTENSYVQHLGRPTAEQIAKGFNVAATFYFPNASMNVSPHFFFIQRFVPKSPTTSIMHYEVYRNKDSSDEDFTVISDIYKRIMSEDKYLCANAHKNIQAGVFVNGEMHPKMEQGPLFFQGLVRDLVTSHHKKEKKAGKEIWPARQKLDGNAETAEKDLEFCSSLDCSALKKEGLDW